MNNQPPMNFDYFETGRAVGTYLIALAPLVKEWRALFPDDEDADGRTGDFAPLGVLVAAMMHGYTHILDRRLPGNVHATQTLYWGAPAPVAAEVAVSLSCTDKHLRNERRWLSFHLTIDGAEGVRYLGADMRFLWAA